MYESIWQIMAVLPQKAKKWEKMAIKFVKLQFFSFTFHSNNVPIHLLITARRDKTAFATDFTKCCFSSFFYGKYGNLGM